MIAELFEQFLKERIYLKNSTPKTIEFYKSSFVAYQKALGKASELPAKADLNRFVIGMREQGLEPTSCNTYIRGFNCFLSWLYENEHTAEHLKIKQIKVEQRVLKTFTDTQLKQIISWKPKRFYDQRLYAMICLMMDTGIRIEECLTLKREKVDFDNMLITVMGKGRKERTIPISFECRKVLYRFTNTHRFEHVFSTKQGNRMLYDNCRRDFQRLMQELGIDGFEGSFHALRRAFARSYVRNGGNLFYLMKSLGHTTLTMSKKYVEVDAEDLRTVQPKTSILSRLR